jgi:hypothetical protein
MTRRKFYQLTTSFEKYKNYYKYTYKTIDVGVQVAFKHVIERKKKNVILLFCFCFIWGEGEGCGHKYHFYNEEWLRSFK